MSDGDELAELVREAATRHRVPGIAVGIVHEGRERYAYHGVTSVEAPLPVDARTLFQIGSTGKTLTATLILCLAGAGLVGLDAPVRRYLPDFRVQDPGVSARVTVLNLLDHTAGWDGDFAPDTGWGDDALARFVAAMTDLPQATPLGALASYNDAAYSVAGRVAEVVTGLTFEDALRRHLLDPLGMTETHPCALMNEVITRRFAVGHTRRDGRVTVARPWSRPRAYGPAGGLVSTAADQIRYARFHLGDGRAADGAGLPAPATMAWMRRPAAETVGGARVGVSWFLRDVAGVRFAFHGGTAIGQQSAFEIAPERGFAVTVLTNAEHGFGLCDEVTAWARRTCLGLEEPDPAIGTGRVPRPAVTEEAP